MTFFPTERAPCLVCGACDFRPLQTLRDRLWSRGGEFEMSQCRVCTHAFLSVRPTRESMSAYYDGLYDAGGLRIEEHLQRSILAHVLNWRRMRALNARHKFKRGAYHLDVGCGVSSLLRQLAGRGLCVVGLDFEEAACRSQREFCKGLNVELWRGTLQGAKNAGGEQVKLNSAHFSSVSMIHYLEHSFSPVEDLKCAYDLLEPNGIVIVEVPALESLNRSLFRSFWLPYLPPQHLSLFSRRSLKRSLQQAGFQGIRIRGASAPSIALSSFAIWWTWMLGRKSRVPRLLQPLLWPLAAVLGLLVFVSDTASFWMLAKTGHADHLRATAIKKTVV